MSSSVRGAGGIELYESACGEWHYLAVVWPNRGEERS